MKIKNYIFFSMLLFGYSHSQSILAQQNQNYIIERVYQQAGGKEDSALVTVKYFDGLGRPLQTVAVGMSPNRKDIVTPIGYDALGREHRKYLPYEASSTTGLYHPHDLTPAGYTSTEQYKYYSKTLTNTNTDIPDTDYPFAETVFEASPLNRVLEQGAPGEEWQPKGITPNSGHTVGMAYGTNTAGEVIRWDVDASGALLKDGFYAAGTLYMTQTTDENGVASREYKDLQGQVVLKMAAVDSIVQTRTYYVYDDMGRLRYVLPPMFVDGMGTTASFTASSDLVKSYGYYYAYDGRSRMTVKQLPGAGAVRMVYDVRDRLVATQDSVQRDSSKWLITKYDALNRPVATAMFSFPHGQDSLQRYANTFSESSLFEIRNNSYALGYTKCSFPGIDIPDSNYLTVTYYDDYGFPGVLAFSEVNGINISSYSDNTGHTKYFDTVKGFVTGSKVKVLETSVWLNSTTYYDNRYRVIQTRSDLYDGSNGGKETTSTLYDFAGKVMRTKQNQVFGSENTTVDKYMAYDHPGRLTKVEQAINGTNPTILSEQTYNALGQLMQKKMGNSAQTVDYEYNIRGWLTKINDPTNLGTDLFSMQLLYNDNYAIAGLTSAAQFNGNISGTIVNRKDDNGTGTTIFGYGYSYDALNRLISSDYGEGTTFTTNQDSYNEFGITYDLNGNITHLKRNDASGLIDDLTYAYKNTKSNQLIRVDDASSATLGFKNVPGDDYSYDANGNLTKNLNKGITTISYNLLNLPRVLSKDENNSITYVYSATGAKLCKAAKVNGALNKRYYVGGFEYDNTKALALMHTGEGLVEVSTTEGVKTYSYEYFLKDHLGNTRVVYNSSGEVVQRTDYYPFGMTAGLGYNGNPDNKYLFAGKELQDDQIGSVSLDWVDFGRRMYDPQLGIFRVQDRFAEKYHWMTPYQYAANNPIKFTDFNGDSINVAAIQQYDKKNGTDFLTKIISDLNSQTGYTFSVSASGQLVYAQDKDGNAIISTTTDKNGNTVQVGSQEARDIMSSAIGNETTAFARIVPGSSNAPRNGGLINLNPAQINGFISGANNLDNRTLGWGMSFMHETLHSKVGGGLSDYLPAGTVTGQVEDRLNIVRQQLNQQGGNYGQRMMYQGTYFTPTGSPIYIPFDDEAYFSIVVGVPPALCGKNIKF